MTTLAALVEAARTARSAAPGSIEASADHEIALVDYLLAHAADLAERERLERAVVEATKAAEADIADADNEEYWMTSRQYEALDALAMWLIAHAGADA